MVIRQRKGGVMEWMMIPKMMKWARRGTRPATCPNNSQQMAICLDEPREAQYMAGFIALQMSRMWGMFEAGDKRTIDAALRGAPTTTWRATPTSLCLIVLVLFC